MNAFQQTFERFLRWMTLGLAAVSGAAILGMMLITVADVVMRMGGHPIQGSYDLVRILSVIALACALPYTTAVKGHVAVEYFFHKMRRSRQVGVDTVMRALMIALFALLAVRCIQHGRQLQEANELMLTLLCPVYWIPWTIAFSCAASGLVVIYHLLFPGKAILRP